MRLERLLPLAVAVLMAACSMVTADVVVLMGDKDNVANFTLPGDASTRRAAYENAAQHDWGLYNLFQGIARNFDRVSDSEGNQLFAATFQNLPAIDPSYPVTLEIGLKADLYTNQNDLLHLQYNNDPPPADYKTNAWYLDNHYYWGRSLNAVWTDTGHTGTWDSHETMVATFDLKALPWGSGTMDLLPQINFDGYLDVSVSDDTAVDYMQLRYTPVPEPATAWLLAAAAFGALPLARRLRRRG
jgi:hypothetical protein